MKNFASVISICLWLPGCRAEIWDMSKHGSGWWGRQHPQTLPGLHFQRQVSLCLCHPQVCVASPLSALPCPCDMTSSAHIVYFSILPHPGKQRLHILGNFFTLDLVARGWSHLIWVLSEIQVQPLTQEFKWDYWCSVSYLSPLTNSNQWQWYFIKRRSKATK